MASTSHPAYDRWEAGTPQPEAMRSATRGLPGSSSCDIDSNPAAARWREGAAKRTDTGHVTTSYDSPAGPGGIPRAPVGRDPAAPTSSKQHYREG
jgi:hypothetical protein